MIDLDLRAYFDTVRHHQVLGQVARRVNDDQVMHLLKLILSASGRQGLPQGGSLSPLLSNLYLNAVDQMLERAQAVTRNQKWTALAYCRFADDLVVLIDAHSRQRGLHKAVEKRLREELTKLQLEVNEDKSRVVDLGKGDQFGFLDSTFVGFAAERGNGCRCGCPKARSVRHYYADSSRCSTVCAPSL